MSARRPLSFVLVVIDSLRDASLRRHGPDALRTPFLEWLDANTVTFARARAAECWTLPTHLSMFTGLLPSEHGAHFQTMAYTAAAPTMAEVFAQAGYATEIVTRNPIFDGSLPGVVRGFQTSTRPVVDLGGPLSVAALGLTLVKPRLRRLLRKSGFFGMLQKTNRHFLWDLACTGVPADRLCLDHALETMAAHRKAGRPYFLFLNLFDVHMPYSPQVHSPLPPLRSWESVRECVEMPFAMAQVFSHGYLRPDFRMAPRRRRMLLRRYATAIELMDAKIAAFYGAARGAGLLDDTVLVVTSDHGEGFGEHGLYCHDASVYDTHLHVPLWIHHPDVAPRRCDDVVTTRELAALARALAAGGRLDGTLLDSAACAARGATLAEHFHYPFTDGLLPRYTRNVAAAVVGTRKLVLRHDDVEIYDLAGDPDEVRPEPGTIELFAERCRHGGAAPAAVAQAVEHLRRWQHRLAA
jgi:Sulfatase